MQLRVYIYVLFDIVAACIRRTHYASSTRDDTDPIIPQNSMNLGFV